MKAQIIQIGNSKGIRIPKAILEEAKVSGEVELEVTTEGILIRNVKQPRGDWDAVFKSLSDVDDNLAPARTVTDFSKKEWQW